MTNQLDGGCERCGRCISSCPTHALSWQLKAPPLLDLVALRIEGKVRP
jgi:ferredoxin